jgi:hypothetical protein
MTGRGAGYCAGYDAPGYASRVPVTYTGPQNYFPRPGRAFVTGQPARGIRGIGRGRGRGNGRGAAGRFGAW